MFFVLLAACRLLLLLTSKALLVAEFHIFSDLEVRSWRRLLRRRLWMLFPEKISEGPSLHIFSDWEHPWGLPCLPWYHLEALVWVHFVCLRCKSSFMSLWILTVFLRLQTRAMKFKITQEFCRSGRIWLHWCVGLNIRSTSNSLFHTSTFGPFSAVSTPIFACFFNALWICNTEKC